MKMLKLVLAACLALASAPALAQEQERISLGWGRMFANDTLGDGHDRWRTGSYQVSVVRGTSFSGGLPQDIGALMEYRASSQIVAPASLTAPLAGDRRYAAMLSLGAHSQFDWRGNDVSLGGDLVITGPQTGISNFQNWIHHQLGLPKPSVVSNQIGNGFYPTFEAEIGRSVGLGDKVTLRPFAATQVGVESFARVGGDLVFGSLGKGAVMVRDSVTGQRYRAVESDHNQGVSFVLGGDLTRVFDSALLPSDGAATLTGERSRLRAGVHWQGEKSSVFYGVSYLSREFEQQPEGQVVGALNLNLKF